MVYCVGLTGNIASGKSTVASFFEDLGIHVFNADKVARELTIEGAGAYHEIIAHFGSQILLDNKQLNRKLLREIIFANIQERLWLEQLLHPEIRQQLAKDVELSSSPYCIVEIPLLKDRKNYPYLHRILLVTSPLDIQIKRLMARDQCTREQALAIIAAQPDNEQRLAQTDDVVVNNDTLSKLKNEIDELHLKYLQLANEVK